jgi:deoxyribose-phosphate aldolase
LLKPTCTVADIKRICEEAIAYQFAAVCIPPSMVKYARQELRSTHPKLATVIGFPFGYEVPEAKLIEMIQALSDGADELDVVINLSLLKSGLWPDLEKEMDQLIALAHSHDKLVKVIIESGILTEAEIVQCCQLYSKLGADFLKTSTGYAEKGASVEAVRLMREHLPPSVKIKASGGIKTYDFAKQLIDAGADRLGCSTSIGIVEEKAQETRYKVQE